MTSATDSPHLTTQQIRQQANDFDEQIRQGIEDGTIRKVMRRLGPMVVSSDFFPDLINH